MSELDVTFVVRVKHADIWEAIQKAGSGKNLAKLLGVSHSLVYQWASLRSAPNLEHPASNSPFASSEFRDRFAATLLRLTGKTLDELWPPELRAATEFLLEDKNFEVTKTYSPESLAYSHTAEQLALPDPCEVASDNERQQQLKAGIVRILKTLTYREREIITLRYGLCGECSHSLKEVATMFKVTPERIRQIEMKAMGKMQKPNLCREIVDCLD